MNYFPSLNQIMSCDVTPLSLCTACSSCNALFSLNFFSFLKLSLYHFLCEALDLHFSALVHAKMMMIYLSAHSLYLFMTQYYAVLLKFYFNNDLHVYFTHTHTPNYVFWGLGLHIYQSVPKKALLHSWQ